MLGGPIIADEVWASHRERDKEHSSDAQCEEKKLAELEAPRESFLTAEEKLDGRKLSSDGSPAIDQVNDDRERHCEQAKEKEWVEKVHGPSHPELNSADHKVEQHLFERLRGLDLKVFNVPVAARA